MKLRIVFWLDVSLLLSFCALETVPFTGLIAHEWLGIALAGIVVVHLLLSWTWIASGTRRLIAGRTGRTLVNYLLNLCLFGSVATTIFSGILISQHALPALTGARPAGAGTDLGWEPIHNRVSDLVLILGGLHLAINWEWIAAAARKLSGGRRILP